MDDVKVSRVVDRVHEVQTQKFERVRRLRHIVNTNYIETSAVVPSCRAASAAEQIEQSHALTLQAR